MKNLFFLIVTLCSTLCLGQTQFSNGYQNGFKEGFCYQIYGCTTPIPPITPLPRINENYTSYKDGYQRGFLDGKNSNRKTTSNSQTQYTPRKYGDYIETYDYNSLHANMHIKRQQYNNQQQKLYKYYSERLFEVRDHSFEYHKKCLEFVKQYQGLYKDAELHYSQITYLNPQNLLDRYPTNIPFEKVEKLIEQLKLNNEKMKSIVLQVENFTSWLLSAPNKILKGVYKSNKIDDFEYDRISKKYVYKKSTLGESYVTFFDNFIQYKRSEKNTIGAGLKYEGIENGFYIFVDGWDNTLALDMSLTKLQVYFDRDINSTQYLKKAIYYNLSK